MNDNQIEQEIQAKGLTAPRVTPADLEANIASELYFTAFDGITGYYTNDGRVMNPTAREGLPKTLGLLTFCVLVLQIQHQHRLVKVQPFLKECHIY